MKVFVTVGTTRFDDLVRQILQPQVLHILRQKGYTELLIQSGKSEFPQDLLTNASQVLAVTQYTFKPDLKADIASADLVVSHAGAGTCLEVLDDARKPLVVVVNDKLMNNHQTELAEKLASEGHLEYCFVSNLAETLETVDPASLTPMPKGDTKAFADWLDTSMEEFMEA